MKLPSQLKLAYDFAYPQIIGALTAISVYCLYHESPSPENVMHITAVTVIMGSIAIGFLLTSTILLTQKKNMPPGIKAMRQTDQYSLLMQHIHIAVRKMLLLMAYAAICLSGIFTANNLYICVYLFLVVSGFLEFRRVILAILAITTTKG